MHRVQCARYGGEGLGAVGACEQLGYQGDIGGERGVQARKTERPAFVEIWWSSSSHEAGQTTRVTLEINAPSLAGSSPPVFLQSACLKCMKRGFPDLYFSVAISLPELEGPQPQSELDHMPCNSCHHPLRQRAQDQDICAFNDST